MSARERQITRRSRRAWAMCGVMLCGMHPLFAAEDFSSVWLSPMGLTVIGIVLCSIAGILWWTPAIFERVCEWREQRNAKLIIHGKKTPTTTQETTARTVRVVAQETDKNTSDALGWSAGEDAPVSAVPQRTASRPQSGTQRTVLIADDDPVVLVALSRRLQRMGFQVFRSPDAMHALLGLNKVRPDLVILDINMPSGNGLAVCEMVASDPSYAGIPIIIHSVTADDATQARSAQLGAHFVAKSPQSWANIQALIKDLLGDIPPPPPAKSVSRAAPSTGAARQASAAAAHAPSTPPPQTPKDAAAPRAGAEESPPAPAEKPAAKPNAVAGHPKELCGHPRILCIENPPDVLQLVEHQLLGLGFQVVRVNDMEEGFWACFTEKPQVVIIQCGEDEKSLRALLRRFAEHPVTRALPLIVINENQLLSPNESLPPTLHLLGSPVDWEALLTELNALLAVFESTPVSERSAAKPELPQRKAAAPVPVEKMDDQSPRAKAAPAGNAPPLKLLCIDDDPVIAQAITQRLAHYGITVLAAADGTQGYLLALSQNPDLVLLDMQMPNGDGHYVLAKLRDNPRTESIPIVILTVESNPGVRRQMLSVGANAYVCKPVHWKELFQEIGRFLELPPQLVHDYGLSEELLLSHL